MSMPTPDARTRNRNRLMLVAIFALFFGSLILAGVLRFSGWRPHGMKNNGELLDPPGDLRKLELVQLDGQPYHWEPIQRRWRILVAPNAGCTTECATIAREIDTVWQLMGKDADDVDVLWLCPDRDCAWPAGAPVPATLHKLQPDDAVRAALPRLADAGATLTARTPVYVVDPNGFVILRYPPGFEPGGLRSDLAKLVKLK